MTKEKDFFQTFCSLSQAFGTAATVEELLNLIVDSAKKAMKGKWLIDHPWGRVTLVDLYLGFILFSGWIIQRERNIVASVIWVIALMMWGHLAGAVYVIKALLQSKGDRNYFWLGDKPEPAEAGA